MTDTATPGDRPAYEGNLGDPFILRHGGVYYAYGTAKTDGDRVVPVLRSQDLRSWESLGGCLEPRPVGRDWSYWAPEVIEDQGRFLMYYSVGIGDAGHSIRVAQSASPEGPFRDVGADLTPHERFAIDPHPFTDVDGQTYLFFAKDFLDGPFAGTALVVDRLVGPYRLAGEPTTVLRASADWQRFERGRRMYGSVYDWYTLEGPFVVRHGGRYHLFYSGGNWQDESYGVSWAVADHPLGPWTEPVPGGPAVLRSGSSGWTGPGHNSVLTDVDGAQRFVFHAWDDARERRQVWIRDLVWKDGRPTVAGVGSG